MHEYLSCTVQMAASVSEKIHVTAHTDFVYKYSKHATVLQIKEKDGVEFAWKTLKQCD